MKTLLLIICALLVGCNSHFTAPDQTTPASDPTSGGGCPLPTPAPTVTQTASPGPTVIVTTSPKPAPTVTVTTTPTVGPTPIPTVTVLPSPVPCASGTVVDAITNGDFNAVSPDSTGVNFGTDLAKLVAGTSNPWDVFTTVPGWYSEGAAQLEVWSPTFNGGDTAVLLDGSITVEVKANGPGSVYQNFCSSGVGNILTFQLASRTGLVNNSVLNVLVDGKQIGVQVNATNTGFEPISYYIPSSNATAGMHVLQLQAPAITADPNNTVGVDIRHVRLYPGPLGVIQ